MKKGILIIAIAIAGVLSGLIKVNASTIEHHWVGDYKDNIIGTWPLDDNLGYIYSYKSNLTYSTTYAGSVSLDRSIPNNNNYIYINGYFKNIQLSNMQDFECNGWDQTNQVCQNWFDGQNSQLSFQLWAGTYSNQCKIEWNFSPYGDVYPTYLFWQAECPITTLTDMFYYRFEVVTPSYNTQSNKYSFGLNRSVNYIQSDGQAIIDNQNQNTQEIINQNATYSDEPKEEVEGKNETVDYEQKEQQLMQSLDFNMTAMDNITINPNASSFIWNIADRLRQINPAIILLMTSILGMGIIKLILNR